jgi:hypothetical protein
VRDLGLVHLTCITPGSEAPAPAFDSLVII